MHSKTLPIHEIVSGLIQLHEETVARYTHALREIQHTEADLRSIFERIIEESKKSGVILSGKIPANNREDFPSLNQWQQERLAIDAEKKNTLSYCIEDVQDIINAYTVALSWPEIPAEISFELLLRLEGFKRLQHHISQFHDAQ